MKTLTVKVLKSFEKFADSLTAQVLTACTAKVTLSDFYKYAESLTIEAVNTAHDIAIFDSFTALEKNMLKRLTTESATSARSMFKQSLASTQSYAIDNAMSEFHSVHELKALLKLSEARIISHKRHLVKEFHHICKLVVSDDSKKFKFVLLNK